MANESPFRSTLERMEEHEIVDRLKRGMYSDEARPTAEAILRERGIDPTNPIVPDDQLEEVARGPAKPWRPRFVPFLFGFFAASMVGRHIGAAAGALGAGLMAAVFFYGGWRVGSWLALRVYALPSRERRFVILASAVVVWIIVCGVIGIFAQTGSGRIRP